MDKTTPQWLRAAVKNAEALKGAKVPAWLPLTALPPIVIGERRLNDEQVQAVLAALQKSTFAEEQPLLFSLMEYADRAALDAFAWRLFETWLGEGAPSKDKWAMMAIGFLGGDVSALKLTPLIRAWPGESQHQRAVLGLDCLRAIGTDTALMQLNGIAQKLKFKGLQQKAREAMEAIAQSKGLTRMQLEDRVVPDCGLDERGSRVFDGWTRRNR